MGELQKWNDCQMIQKHDFFPFFINVKGKKAVVIGGGKIAERRIKTLLKFSFSVTTVAPEFSEGISEIKDSSLIIIKDEFNEKYIDDAFVVVASTNSRDINKKIGEICHNKNIFVSVADSKEECSFYFPAVINWDNEVIGICGNGKDHKSVALKAEEIRQHIKNKKDADIY